MWLDVLWLLSVFSPLWCSYSQFVVVSGGWVGKQSEKRGFRLNLFDLNLGISNFL